MRVLFTALSGIGDLFPLVPIAWAMRNAGHDVLVATGEVTQAGADAGLPIVDVAPGYTLSEQTFENNPRLMAMMASGQVVDDTTLRQLVLGELNRPFVRRTLELVGQWRPDLVVYHQFATFGLIAAAAGGVPGVQRNTITIRTTWSHQAVADHIADDLPRLTNPAAVIEGVPPSLLDPSQHEGWFMRDIPYAGGAVLGTSLPRLPDRPRIAVTLGSTLPRFKGMGLLDPIIAAAGDIDADFLFAIGGGDPATLGALPPNVETIGFTPFDQLLRTCHAVVHKGASTTMAAIDAGIPQLVFDLDPLVHGPSAAEALGNRGAALVIAPEKIDAAVFQRLLTDPRLRTAAGELRAENAALPSPAAMAERLSGLVA